MGNSKVIIRALTLGLPFTFLGPGDWEKTGNFLVQAEDILHQAGFVIRTKRLVLEPLRPCYDMDSIRLTALLRSVANNSKDLSVRWFCLPVLAGDDWGRDDLRLIGPKLLQENPALFLHYLFLQDILIRENDFNTIAKVIIDISRLSNNGFDNFRVGAGFNIMAGTPFFPFSWHKVQKEHAGKASFSFAVESLEPTLNFFETQAKNLDKDSISTHLTQELATICQRVDLAGIELEKRTNGVFTYAGLDISLAPYPDNRHSLADLLEKFGLQRFGGLGTSALTFFFTKLLKDAVHQSKARAAGFNGIMFSPLEDMGLAKRLNSDDLLIEHFMLWSTLCGCGVDMLPIEGNTSVESLAALYRDVYALSLARQKPLGVRVLPIPGRRVNELTSFNHDFLTNCRIVQVRGGIRDLYMQGQ